jgi:hypothetical protein
MIPTRVTAIVILAVGIGVPSAAIAQEISQKPALFIAIDMSASTRTETQSAPRVALNLIRQLDNPNTSNIPLSEVPKLVEFASDVRYPAAKANLEKDVKEWEDLLQQNRNDLGRCDDGNNPFRLPFKEIPGEESGIDLCRTMFERLFPKIRDWAATIPPSTRAVAIIVSDGEPSSQAEKGSPLHWALPETPLSEERMLEVFFVYTGKPNRMSTIRELWSKLEIRENIQVAFEETLSVSHVLEELRRVMDPKNATHTLILSNSKCSVTRSGDGGHLLVYGSLNIKSGYPANVELTWTANVFDGKNNREPVARVSNLPPLLASRSPGREEEIVNWTTAVNAGRQIDWPLHVAFAYRVGKVDTLHWRERSLQSIAICELDLPRYLEVSEFVHIRNFLQPPDTHPFILTYTPRSDTLINAPVTIRRLPVVEQSELEDKVPLSNGDITEKHSEELTVKGWNWWDWLWSSEFRSAYKYSYPNYTASVQMRLADGTSGAESLDGDLTFTYVGLDIVVVAGLVSLLWGVVLFAVWRRRKPLRGHQPPAPLAGEISPWHAWLERLGREEVAGGAVIAGVVIILTVGLAERGVITNLRSHSFVGRIAVDAYFIGIATLMLSIEEFHEIKPRPLLVKLSTFGFFIFACLLQGYVTAIVVVLLRFVPSHLREAIHNTGGGG